jgi:hypothetical protein
MRPGRCLLVVCTCVAILTPVSAQQANPAAVSLKDAEAVAILGKALDAAGGQSAFTSGYTASGTITHRWGEKDEEGPVTLNGRATGDFRMDESLPSGLRSWASVRGKAQTKVQDGTVAEILGSSVLSPSGLANPYFLLAQAFMGKFYAVSYKGQTTVDGKLAYDIQIARALIQSDGKFEDVEIGALDVFIDASSFQILMTRDQDRPSRNSLDGPAHELRFSDYRTVNNTLVPYSIIESIGNQETWRIQVSNFEFNTSLSDSTLSLR